MTVERSDANARLLLVDDDVVILRALSNALAGFGDVRFATRAADALRLLDQEPVELLLVDAEMPGMSGLSLLQLLAQRPGPRPRALLVTGHRQATIEASARLLGVVGVLNKPFTPAAVVAAVTAALKEAAATSEPSGLDALLIEPFRILVIADEVYAGDEQLEGIAALCGWVERASTAESALQRSWDQSVDAIAVTGKLRFADPIEVIRSLRAEPSLLSTPVVLLKDDQGAPDELTALLAGASDIVGRGTPVSITQARFVNLMRGKRYADFALAAMRTQAPPPAAPF